MRVLPLEIAGGRDDAAVSLPGFPECGFVFGCFHPGVDDQLFILGEAPLHREDPGLAVFVRG